MRDVFNAPAILLIGNNPTEQHPLLAWQIRTNVRLHRAKLYVANSSPIKLRRQATAFAQIAPGSEGSFVQFLAGNDAAADAVVFAAAHARSARPDARCAEGRERAGHHLRLGVARQRRQGAGRLRPGAGREVHLPGRLRQLARRGRHGPLSRHAARLRAGVERDQLPRRVAGRDSQHARA